MNDDPYKSSLTPESESPSIGKRALSILAVGVGAAIGAGLLGVVVAGEVLRPQNFPLEGPAQKGVMFLVWIALVLVGAFGGGFLGRKSVS